MRNELKKTEAVDEISKLTNSLVKRVLHDLGHKLQNNSKTDCGYDSDRFVSLADDYKEAVMFLDLAESIVRIETDNAGQLKIRFEKFDEQEPVRVISKLSGKVMTLKYERGKFKEEWVKETFGNVADFTGELAEIVLILKIIHSD
jgi:hypothetical protein